MTNIVENEKVKVTITKKEGCNVNFEVTLLPTAIQQARKEAVKEINKSISIAGYRKGKAPEDLITKRFGSAIEDETKKNLANIAFTEAQLLSKIVPIHHTKISYNVKSINLPNEAVLTFSFESEPEVPTIDPKAFKLEAIDLPTVDENKVEEAIRQLRFFYAEWKEVTDRPIQEGDFVMLDLDSLETTPPSKVYSNVRFEVKEGKIAEWMRKLLIGAKKGDSLEGVSEVDKNASEKEKKEFTPKKVKLTVNIVEEALLPNLDDDWAKKLGAQSVTDLKESVKKRLSKQLEEEVDKKKRLQVNEFLYKNYKFDLPSSMVEAEKQYRSEDFLKNSDQSQLSDEEKATFSKNIEEESKRAIALFFLTRKTVQDFKIEITEEDLKRERSLDFFSQKQANNKIEEEEFGILYSRSLLKKVQDLILNQ